MKYHIKGRLDITYADIRDTYENVDMEIEADSEDEALELAIQQVESDEYWHYEDVESEWSRRPVVEEMEDRDTAERHKTYRAMVAAKMPTLFDEVQA